MHRRLTPLADAVAEPEVSTPQPPAVRVISSGSSDHGMMRAVQLVAQFTIHQAQPSADAAQYGVDDDYY